METRMQVQLIWGSTGRCPSGTCKEHLHREREMEMENERQREGNESGQEREREREREDRREGGRKKGGRKGHQNRRLRCRCTIRRSCGTLVMSNIDEVQINLDYSMCSESLHLSNEKERL